MEENRQVLELLEKIERENSQQLKVGKLRCLFSAVTALCLVAVLILALTLVPKINGVIGAADDIAIQAQGIMDQMSTVLEDLEQTTSQMAQVDLEGMVADVNSLVQTGQQSLEQTMEKLNALDMDKLNQAIKDLAAVIEPMARFANMFS